MDKCQHSAHPVLLLRIILILMKQKLGGKPIFGDFAGSTSVRFIDNQCRPTHVLCRIQIMSFKLNKLIQVINKLPI